MWRLRNKNTRNYAYKDTILNCLKENNLEFQR